MLAQHQHANAPPSPEIDHKNSCAADLKEEEDEDDDSMNNASTFCLQSLSTNATNNNSQNLNFNLESIPPNPSTAVGLIQSSLEKSVIDKALQSLAPVQHKLERMISNVQIKSEINEDDVDDGSSSADDDLEFMEISDMLSSNEQKHFTLNENIFENELFSSVQASFNLQVPNLVSSYLNIHYVCETGSRILFLSIHWLSKIAAVEALDRRTQIKLLRCCWPGLLAIALAQCQNISIPTIISTLISNIRQTSEVEKIDAQKIRKLSEHTTLLHAFIQEMREFTTSDEPIDDMEYGFLRLSILFNPRILLRRREAAVKSFVKRVQLYALAELKKHIATKQKSSLEIDERYNALLVNLLPLSALESDTVEELFFSNLVGQVQIKNMIPHILTVGVYPS